VARLLTATVRVLADRAGSDLAWALTLPGPLRERGLGSTGGAAFPLRAAPAGRPGPSPGASMWRLTFEQLRAPMIAAGLLTEREADEIPRVLDDPEVALYGVGVVSAWGRHA
jgi:hypothetical protein